MKDMTVELVSTGPMPAGDEGWSCLSASQRGRNKLPANIQVRQGAVQPVRLRLQREAACALMDGQDLLQGLPQARCV